jgi:organic radical activating enzyme
LPLADVVEAVDRLWRAVPHHSVSVTGGEPLMQAARLAALAPLLVERGHRLSLETNGMLADGLARVLPWLSHVSMDVKLDSVDGQDVSPAAQRRFLEVAYAACPTSVKIVVGARTSPDELERAVAMVAEAAPAGEVFLQPVTPFGHVTAAPTPEQVLELHDLALRIHPATRVVPQTHKIIGQL